MPGLVIKSQVVLGREGGAGLRIDTEARTYRTILDRFRARDGSPEQGGVSFNRWSREKGALEEPPVYSGQLTTTSNPMRTLMGESRAGTVPNGGHATPEDPEQRGAQ